MLVTVILLTFSLSPCAYGGIYGGGGGGGGGGGSGGGTAFSYAQFSGPVADGGKEITVEKGFGGGKYGGGGTAVDYVSEPKYTFSYGVSDSNSGDNHRQRESHDGNRVVGEYSLNEPGGGVRTVKYYTDQKGGFHAEVSNSNGNNHAGGGSGGGGGGFGAGKKY